MRRGGVGGDHGAGPCRAAGAEGLRGRRRKDRERGDAEFLPTPWLSTRAKVGSSAFMFPSGRFDGAVGGQRCGLPILLYPVVAERRDAVELP